MHFLPSYSKVIMFFLIVFSVFGTAIQILVGIPNAGLVDDVVMICVSLTVVALFISGSIKKINIYIVFFIIFIFYLLISGLVNSVSIDVFIIQLRSYVLPLFIIFLISKASIDQSTIHFFIKIIVVITIILFCSSLIELGIGRPLLYAENRFGDQIYFGDQFRAYSLIGNPIDFSNFIMLALIVIYSSAVSGFISTGKGKILIFICILCLLLSASRGPILATVFTFFLYYRHRGYSIKKIIKWSVLLSPLILVLGAQLISRFSDISINYFSADQYRAVYLVKSIEILIDNFLFGVGPGKFGGWVSINYHESEIYRLYNIDTKGISSVDMFWPHFIPEVGIIGTIIFLYPFIKIFKISKKTGKKISEKINRKTRSGELFLSTNIQLMFPAAFLVGLFSISLETQLFSSILSILCGLFIKVLYDKSCLYSITTR